MLKELLIPIIQAPMLGASTPAMAAAVSRAGGLGSLAPGLSADAMAQAAATVRAATDRPFAMNLFVLGPTTPVAAEVAQAVAVLTPYYATLGLPPPTAPARWAEDFAAQFQALLACRPAVASFTFGCLTAEQVSSLHAVGTAVVGTATTVAEARAWAAVGADAICAQGCEAGGHRGSFLAPVAASLIGTMALLPAICDAVPLPVIAAGGIMDGRGIAAALALGADAVQLGTAFLLCPEAATSAAWRQAIASAGDDPTRLTRAFSGRFARGIENRFMRELRPIEDTLPAYPVQNALTQPLRAAAARAGDPELMSLWAGQGVRNARALGAAELVRTLWDEAKAALRATAQRVALP
ncbi:MAG TPA: nitronate monooxygenase [Pseudomonadota bacterium]|nr:nitronate monooxygenase [Pseudomonadota bacterium]